jgi:8-oxo-dGTP pyrophosphatase MutT (NUDIX family)
LPDSSGGTAQDPRVTALEVLFAAHHPSDAEEADAVRHLRRLLLGERDAFARTTLPAHVTASAVVVDPASRHVLLHLHRRLGRWLQPGGHIEVGERPEDAVLRETVEETGIVAQHPASGPIVVHLDEHPGPDGHIHLDLRYLLHADRSAAPLGSGETTGSGPGATLRWVAMTEVARLTDRSLERAILVLQRTLDDDPARAGI